MNKPHACESSGLDDGQARVVEHKFQTRAGTVIKPFSNCMTKYYGDFKSMYVSLVK